ncbi:ABC transporter ATP-binding protein [Sulfurimonas sp.]|uniref:ABC transporter ATP-binding protein n=1 Tax=Sulfurimonas sp. TaxID=2022749 RepID=UPI003D11760B
MILEAKNITHFYGNEKALDDVSIFIKTGEFVAIVGKSGSGKSTLISILATLLKPTNANMTLLNHKSEDIKDIDTFRKENIGFIFQFHYLINYLTVYENITLAVDKIDKNEVTELLKYLEIYELKDKYPYEISGGQRQRVAIARALVNKPKIIFADEPTGNLDSQNSDNVFKLLQKIARENGVSIVVTTHDLDLAKKADTIYEMSDGHISNYN